MAMTAPMTGTVIAFPMMRLSFAVFPASLHRFGGKPCNAALSGPVMRRSMDNSPVPSPKANTCKLGPEAVKHSTRSGCIAFEDHAVRPEGVLLMSTTATEFVPEPVSSIRSLYSFFQSSRFCCCCSVFLLACFSAAGRRSSNVFNETCFVKGNGSVNAAGPNN